MSKLERFTHTKQAAMFLLIVFIGLALSQVVTPHAALASNIAVPVFYATDRTLNDGASDLDYSNDQMPKNEMNFGVKNIVTTDNNLPSGDSARSLGLGWWSPYGDAKNSNPLLRNVTLHRQELLAQLQKTVTEGPSNRPLVVYLNGCCQPFQSSIEAAARIGRSMEAPVLLYAWAAMPPTDKKYRENENRQNCGDKRFHDFLADLEKSVPADRLVLIAHSMGNRFLHKALRERYFEHGSNDNFPTFRAALFTCADVNVDDFVGDEDGISWNSDQTWVTANDTDLALTGSQIQRGFYGRLGAPRGALRKLIDTDGVDVVDTHWIEFGKHDFPLELTTQLVRKTDGGFRNKYTLVQKKTHLFQAQTL